MNKKTVLITGSSGYIGQVLSKKLLSRGYYVIGVDNLMYGQEKNSAHEFTYTDLNSRKGWLSLEKRIRSLKPQYIINLAALVGAPICEKNPETAWDINNGFISDLMNLLVEMRQSNNYRPHILYPNTNSGYGSSGESICTEDSPIRPISVYGESKYMGELTVYNRCENNGIPYTIFRLATVFGMSPRPRFDLLVNDFIQRIHFDKKIIIFEPHFRRNFVHIEDVCDGFVFAMENKLNGIYNFGNDSLNMTKMELAQKINREMGNYAEISVGNGVDPDKRDYHVSSEKILKTGFKFNYGIEECVTEVTKFLADKTPNDIKNMRNC